MSNNKLIGEVMLGGDTIPTVKSSAYFREALECMDQHQLGLVCITDRDGKLLGILTDGDIRRIFLTSQDPLPQLFVKSVDKLMIRNPTTIDETQTLDEGIRMMNDRKIWVVPVTSTTGKCVGVFHMQWALKELLT